MAKLLHDGNLLAYLVLCTAELVYERGIAGAGEVALPELAHTVTLGLARDNFDSLSGGSVTSRACK